MLYSMPCVTNKHKNVVVVKDNCTLRVVISLSGWICWAAGGSQLKSLQNLMYSVLCEFFLMYLKLLYCTRQGLSLRLLYFFTEVTVHRQNRFLNKKNTYLRS